MTLWELPPVGRKVDVNTGYVQAPTIPGYRAFWLNSGTAALALALCVSKQRAGKNAVPQVILPAYGCPDLVAAAVYAGVQPVLVDIGERDPGYNLEALQAAMNSDVVAVVAVNFLGIADRLDEIRRLVNAQPSTLLIEDNAQWFPEAALTATETLRGDLVITSFGRGKPINLMGGGALWVKDEFAALATELAPEGAQSGTPASPGLGLRTKGAIFNLALNPSVYYWLSRLPVLGVGQTAYHRLKEVQAMDPQRLFLLGENIKGYVEGFDSQRQLYDQSLKTMFAEVCALPLACADRAHRLLRYPLLCMGAREDTVRRLRNRKLGISGMYQQPLIEISGVRPQVEQSGGNSGAQVFATRLLTLPVHAGVTTRIINETLVFLRANL